MKFTAAVTLFQFHMVRLKEQPIYNKELFFGFQFHKVRLKVWKRYLKSCFSSCFSIPQGTIKSRGRHSCD